LRLAVVEPHRREEAALRRHPRHRLAYERQPVEARDRVPLEVDEDPGPDDHGRGEPVGVRGGPQQRGAAEVVHDEVRALDPELGERRGDERRVHPRRVVPVPRLLRLAEAGQVPRDRARELADPLEQRRPVGRRPRLAVEQDDGLGRVARPRLEQRRAQPERGQLAALDRAHGTRGATSELGSRRVRAARMFFFFSNRLGCMGSLMLSIAVTIVIIAVLRLA
jgi:hypothetical protein